MAAATSDIPEDFTQADLAQLRAYLAMWGAAVAALVVFIHNEYALLPAQEVFLFLPIIGGLVWRSNFLALVGFILIAGLQSEIYNRQMQIVRLHVDSPMQLFDMVVAGGVVLLLSAQYGLSNLTSLKLRQWGIGRLVRLAFHGLPPADTNAESTEPQANWLDKVLQTAAFVPLWPVLAFWLWWAIQMAAAVASELIFGELSRRGVLPWTVMLLVTTVWLLGMITAITWTILAYLSWRFMKPEEARLELIDLVWREHRRELDQQAAYLSRRRS